MHMNREASFKILMVLEEPKSLSAASSLSPISNLADSTARLVINSWAGIFYNCETIYSLPS